MFSSFQKENGSQSFPTPIIYHNLFRWHPMPTQEHMTQDIIKVALIYDKKSTSQKKKIIMIRRVTFAKDGPFIANK